MCGLKPIKIIEIENRTYIVDITIAFIYKCDSYIDYICSVFDRSFIIYNTAYYKILKYLNFGFVVPFVCTLGSWS